MSSDRDWQPDDESRDALVEFLAQFGITPGPDGEIDMAEVMRKLEPAMQQFAAQMAAMGPTDDSGINWVFTKDAARKVTASLGADPTPSALARQQVVDAAQLADLWLDEVTSFPRVAAPAAAWSRAEWVENSFPAWRQMVRPVVSSLSRALTSLMQRQEGPEELAGMRAMMDPMMTQAASALLGAQIGSSIGNLAAAVVSGTDIGLPLLETPRVALLPTNVSAFAEGLEQDANDVRLYLTIREAARMRLFASVPWLGPQLLALVEHYARDITIDPSALEAAIEQQLSEASRPEDLEAIGQTLAGRLFAPEVTADQEHTLARLETLLALVEGWVDHIVSEAVQRWMPSAAVLTEVVRRRRASGGPAEQALKALVGLELRPRRVRDAANLWAAVRNARGTAACEEAWAHPDFIPSAADLDDPLDFATHGRRMAEPDAMDAELAKLLDEERPGEY